MVGGSETLIQGGIHLAKLDPAKSSEVGKLRPVILLTGQFMLDSAPPVVLICPLSTQNYSVVSFLHVPIPARELLKKPSFALVEHCRSIAIQRIISPRLAMCEYSELDAIKHRVQRLLGF
jgi:mRNA interferase MazF